MANQTPTTTVTWRELVLEEMKCHHDSYDDYLGSSITDEELDRPFNAFDDAYTYHSVSVLIATSNRVYFNSDKYDIDACEYRAAIVSLPKKGWECIHGPLPFL
jgi:hypothetical protein